MRRVRDHECLAHAEEAPQSSHRFFISFRIEEAAPIGTRPEVIHTELIRVLRRPRRRPAVAMQRNII